MTIRATPIKRYSSPLLAAALRELVRALARA